MFRPGRPRLSAQSSFSKATPASSVMGKNQKVSSSSRTTSTQLRIRDSVPGSSDVEEELVQDAEPSGNLSGRKVLSGVIIQNMTSKTSKRSSVSSLSSLGASTRDNSIEYDTPGTSAVTTPAELSIGKGKRSLTIPSVVTNGKRKRSSRLGLQQKGPDTSRDAQLAQTLQQEEYGVVNPKRMKTGPVSRKVIIDATDDEDDLSSVISEISIPSSDDFDPPEAGPSSRRKTRNLSTRAVGNKPRKSLILDSDSDLSAIPSTDSEDEFIDDALSLMDDSEEDIPLMSLVNDNVSIVSADATSVTAVAISKKARRRKGKTPKKDDPSFLRKRVEYMRKHRIHRFTPQHRKRFNLENAHPEILTMWETLKAIPTIVPVAAKQPESINRKLKSFQLEGLDWMTKQEKTQYKGGLLGDEMGMGKTIQAVSLIMSDYPAKDPTLVVVPPVALMQWQNEISEYTNGKLKVLVHHGSNTKSKNVSPKELKKYDVIIISYNTLESMYRKETKGWGRGEDIIKEDSPIHALHFHRLILDEAHSIKQRTTGVAKACFALKGSYKWCLSGTPVQNRIGEFFSLLRFLEVRPFADYFCEKCPCAQLHWSLNEDYMCSSCGHSGAEHASVFNQELLNPITGESLILRDEALEKLHLITARVMLRRMKRDHTSSMELPPKEIIIHKEFFGEIERDFSSSIMTNTTRQFDTYVSRGVMLNNYANIFGLIMQMRQVANHPDLLLKKHAEGGQNVLVCNICDEPAEEAIRSRCKHEFCRACVKAYVRSYEGSREGADCPRCHIPLSIDWDQPDIEQDEDLVKKSSIINRIKMENWTSSTKIEMLVYDLYKLRSKKQTLKSIVFSQFTSMLQLIEWRLRRAGFNTVMLDGTMTPVQRQRSIDYFMNNTDVEVFLVSLKAGGVALNLTEASRVFIVDPWWNPAAEWQSADRCHRIGQRRPCVITRLCIEDSVESRMVMLQEKKANMINSTINNDKVAMDKLSPEDLQFLFRGT